MVGSRYDAPHCDYSDKGKAIRALTGDNRFTKDIDDIHFYCLHNKFFCLNSTNILFQSTYPLSVSGVPIFLSSI